MPANFKITFKRINHITVAVPKDEEAKARAFYEGVLGLEEEPQDNGLQGHYKLVWYKFLDVILHLDFTPPFPIPAENHHIAVEVKHLAEVRRYLESKGAEIREAVPVPNCNRFYLIDPFGTYFELLEKE